MELKVVLKGRRDKARPKVTSPEDAYRAMKFLERQDREHAYVLHLDAASQIIAKEHVGIGSLAQCPAEVREIFKGAILNNSCSIIFIHNHPSGSTAPSENDRLLTQKLHKAGEILGIPLTDSIIVGGGYCSLRGDQSLEKEYGIKNIWRIAAGDERRPSQVNDVGEVNYELSCAYWRMLSWRDRLESLATGKGGLPKAQVNRAKRLLEGHIRRALRSAEKVLGAAPQQQVIASGR
jgi:DNA repair protein RadC